MFKNIAKLAESLKDNSYEIELEVRMKIPPPINFKSDKNRIITYYKSSICPSVTFRSSSDYKIQTKELIEKRKINGVMTYLSLEKTYESFSIKIPLIKNNKRSISRMIVNENPLAEIIKHKDEYTLEIEFNLSNHDKVEEIVNKYKCVYFPLSKPMEISTTELARKLSNSIDWCISLKADGIHVLIIEGLKSRVLLFDNGKIMSINNKVKRKMIEAINVFEGEIMENGSILYYDCLVYNQQDITKINYLERIKHIKYNLKPYLLFNNIEELNSYIYEVPIFKTDGFIISNINNKQQTFKSKFINTVDLKYKNGYLLLENEDISERIPKTNYDYIDDEIYEFNMDYKLVRKREDKIIANYKMPYDNNPLYKIVNGYGIPLLRIRNNKIKYNMLKTLPKDNLLDIGSGKGGDISKWIDLEFSRVYALDPLIDFRVHNDSIIEIKSKEVPSFITYKSVSILFVPWDNSFIDIISKADRCILILMDNPKNYNCEQFNCQVENDKVTLNIPYSETASHIVETKTNIENIMSRLKGWECEKYNPAFDSNLTENEKILSYMYNYYILWRNHT